MKVQYLKVFTGPAFELQKVRVPEKAVVPDDFDLSTLGGQFWYAEQVQKLGDV